VTQYSPEVLIIRPPACFCQLGCDQKLRYDLEWPKLSSKLIKYCSCYDVKRVSTKYINFPDKLINLRTAARIIHESPNIFNIYPFLCHVPNLERFCLMSVLLCIVTFDQSQTINSQTPEKSKRAHCPPTSPDGLRDIEMDVIILLEVITADLQTRIGWFFYFQKNQSQKSVLGHWKNQKACSLSSNLTKKQLRDIETDVISLFIVLKVKFLQEWCSHRS